MVSRTRWRRLRRCRWCRARSSRPSPARRWGAGAVEQPAVGERSIVLEREVAGGMDAQGLQHRQAAGDLIYRVRGSFVGAELADEDRLGGSADLGELRPQVDDPPLQHVRFRVHVMGDPVDMTRQPRVHQVLPVGALASDRHRRRQLDVVQRGLGLHPRADRGDQGDHVGLRDRPAAVRLVPHFGDSQDGGIILPDVQHASDRGVRPSGPVGVSRGPGRIMPG